MIEPCNSFLGKKFVLTFAPPPYHFTNGPSLITHNLITLVSTIYHMKLMQSLALEQKCFDLRSISCAPHNLWLLLVSINGKCYKVLFSLHVIIATSRSGTGSTTSTGDMTLPTVCPPGGCKAIDRPLVDSSATVYVIFGLKSIDRSKITREHVIEKKVNLNSKCSHSILECSSWFISY